jgi:hypothetical protein
MKPVGSFLTEKVLIELCWDSHALEGIKKPQVARYITHFQQSERRRHHAAAAPHAAFNNCSWDLGSQEVFDRINQGADSRMSGHRVGQDPAYDLSFFLCQIEREVLLRLKSAQLHSRRSEHSFN